MVETDGAFRTTDMTLASVLAAAGFTYLVERLNSTSIAWLFEPALEREEEFDNLVGAYDERGCKVEPRSFMEEVARIRREMYDALGIKPNSRRRAPSATSGQ